MQQNEELCNLLLQIADDDLVLGHRDSEWLGIAPEIEGDIAFSSVSQDEVGHAAYLYGVVESLTGLTADELAYARATGKWRNAVLLELPNHDWAFTIVRHFLYDHFETVRLEAAVNSSFAPLADGARKIIREEYYHHTHFKLVFERLLNAGGEATERMTAAWQRIVPSVWTLFDFGPEADTWFSEGWLTESADELKARFLDRVNASLPKEIAPLRLEQLSATDGSGRSGHSRHLSGLLETMREVYDSDPAASW